MQYKSAHQLQEIGGDVKTIQVTSVILSHDYNDPTGANLYAFHCHRCGNVVIQYKGFVVSVLPGLAPVKLPTILRCQNSKCKQHYSFQTIV
jgi:hypothetical protein